MSLFLLILNFITPFVMLVVGMILKHFPVSGMDSHNGYNTPISRRSQAHWDYAQSIAPDIFIKIGGWSAIAIVLLTALLLLLEVKVEISFYIGMGAGLLFLLLAFYTTDKQIKQNFSN